MPDDNNPTLEKLYALFNIIADSSLPEMISRSSSINQPDRAMRGLSAYREWQSNKKTEDSEVVCRIDTELHTEFMRNLNPESITHQIGK